MTSRKPLPPRNSSVVSILKRLALPNWTETSEIGFTGLVYQPVVLGEAKDTALSGAIFGSCFDNFTIRAEYAHLPTQILKSVTGLMTIMTSIGGLL